MDLSSLGQRLEKDLECPETAVVITSLDGKILGWSTGAEKVWGYSSQEVLGKHVSLLEHPRARAVEPILSEAARRVESAKTYLVTGVDKTGHPREVAVTAVPVMGPEGDIEAVSATIQDLGQQRRMAEAARKLVDLFTYTKTGICVANPKSVTFDLLNPAFAEMHGYTVEELTGRPLLTVFPPDRLADLQNCIGVAQEAGTHSFETLHTRKDGSTFPVLIDVSCVRGPDGSVLHIVAYVHDITRAAWAERRARQAEELRKREGELSEVIRQMRAGVMIADAASRKIMVANDEAVRILGPAVQAGELLDEARSRLRVLRANGMPLSLPEDWPLERTLRGEVVSDEEFRVESDAGSTVFLTSSAPIRNTRGQIELAVATFHDITERKRQEEEVYALSERLERRVTERTADLMRKVDEMEAFAYTVAHDLRAPLRAMHGFVDLLMAEAGPRGDIHDFATRIREAAGRMDDLITDLLSYARYTYQEIPVIPVSLNQALGRALIPWRNRLVNGELELTVADPLPDVLGDELVLVQAITQLIDNAAKFVLPGESPRIRIYSEIEGAKVRLYVEDHGIGIPSEHVDRIFGIFERLHRVEEYPGTGIGLAIVRKSIERLGGRVGVSSVVGKGSRFWIELAQAPTKPSSPEPNP